MAGTNGEVHVRPRAPDRQARKPALWGLPSVGKNAICVRSPSKRGTRSSGRNVGLSKNTVMENHQAGGAGLVTQA